MGARKKALGIIVAVMMVAACSSGSDDTTTATSAGTESAPTATTQAVASEPIDTSPSTSVAETSTPATSAPTLPPDFDYASSAAGQLAALEADDSIDDVTIALTKFAWLFGPVPGAIELPDDDSRPISGTQVLDQLTVVADELDDAQKQAIADRLQPYFTDSAIQGLRAPQAPNESQIRAALDRLTPEVIGRLGGDIPEIDLSVVSNTGPDANTAEVTPWLTVSRQARIALEGLFGSTDWGTIGDWECKMVVNSASSMLDGPLDPIIAHELFHCWSAKNASSFDGHTATPDFFQEGLASWVGEQYGPIALTPISWAGYLNANDPNPIYMDYDGLGYWSWLGSLPGVDMWGGAETALRIAERGDANAVAKETAAALVPTEQLHTLGMVRLQDPTLGDGWAYPASVNLAGVTPTVDNRGTIDGYPFAARAMLVDSFTISLPEVDEITGFKIEATGNFAIRFPDGTVEVGVGTDDTFDRAYKTCSSPPCECPDGDRFPGAYTDEPVEPGEITVALSFGATFDAIQVDPCNSETVQFEPTNGERWVATDDAARANAQALTQGLAEVTGITNGAIYLEFDNDLVTMTYDGFTFITDLGAAFEYEMNGTIQYRRDGNKWQPLGGEVSMSVGGVETPLTLDSNDTGLGAPITVDAQITGAVLTTVAAEDFVYIPTTWEPAD